MPLIDRRPWERAALVAWHLAHGEAMLTSDVAQVTGLGIRGARRLVECISRVLPIYQDEEGFWEVIEARDLD